MLFLNEHETTLWQQHDSVLMVHHDCKSRSPAPPNAVHQAPNRLICSNCKIPGHSINTYCFECGGAEGQTPTKKRSRPNIQNRGQKETTANVARENHSSSSILELWHICAMTNPFILHTIKLIP